MKSGGSSSKSRNEDLAVYVCISYKSVANLFKVTKKTSIRELLGLALSHFDRSQVPSEGLSYTLVDDDENPRPYGELVWDTLDAVPRGMLYLCEWEEKCATSKGSRLQCNAQQAESKISSVIFFGTQIKPSYCALS